ncbi:hypothetical protein [Pseudoalteromonas sp. BDTF-M6]|uniref:hypothetical protein n=1 Tax=Pseudoalteromonas sp. BDTF-M6 TaxID=2796132 RepID=UPI001BAEB5A9|nr:hypothetical protein [Pseudoalteromonas sp. BDTF-M6]MBS3797992.1 hypothetical protein [Pseudoalteromonas sp. BDTF-M6]
MKKTILTLGMLALGGLLAYFFLPSADKQQAMQITEVSEEKNTQQQNASQGKKKPTKRYVPEPFPEQTLDSELCENLKELFNQHHFQNRQQLELLAARALKQGHSLDDISLALWAAGMDARALVYWHNSTAALQASLKQRTAIKSYIQKNIPANPQTEVETAQARAMASFIERLDELPMQMQQDKRLPSSFHMDYLYRNTLAQQGLEELIIGNVPAYELAQKVKDLIYDVDTTLVNDPQLTPLKIPFTSLLMLGKTEAAAMLSEQYPLAFRNDSLFISDMQQVVLEHIEAFGSTLTDADALSRLIQGTQLGSKRYYYHRQGQLAIERAPSILRQLGIHIDIHPLTELPRDNGSTPLTFAAPDALDAQQQVQLEACSARNTWFEEREKPIKQWQEFTDSEFVEAVTQSPEFDYCQSHNDKEMELFINDSAALLMSLAQNKPLSELMRLELDNLNLPPLSEQQKAAMGMFISSMAVLDNKLAQQEIVNKLSNAGLAPSIEAYQVLTQFAGSKELTLWLKTFSHIPEQTALELANAVAAKGHIAQYKLLEPYLGATNGERLDPLYFVLKNYRLDHYLPPESGTERPINYRRFLEHLRDNGAEIQPHHRRLMMKNRFEQPEIYQHLITLLPELAVNNSDGYFAVSCQ